MSAMLMENLILWSEYPFTRTELPSTLVDLLQLRARLNPRGSAYSWLADGLEVAPSGNLDGTISYFGLDLRARALAVYMLTRMGLEAGDRVLLLYPPGLEFVCGFFGCLYAGLIAVPAYPPRPNRAPDHLRGLAVDAQISGALTCDSLWHLIQRQLPTHPILEKMAWSRSDMDLPSNYASMAESWLRPAIGPSTIAFLQYTSGSTSEPKGVAVSHGNILQNQWMIQQYFKHDESTRVLGWLPLYHDMGLIGNLLQPLYLGAPCFLMPSLVFLQRPLKWLQSISKHKITTSGGPNFGYDLCVEAAAKGISEGLDLSSWKLAFTGAEPIRALTMDAFSKTFSPYGFNQSAFYPCYGLAETTLITSGGDAQNSSPRLSISSKALRENRIETSMPSDPDATVFVSNGFAPNGSDILIVDPDTQTDQGENKLGEIWIKGPHIAQGYWGKPMETEAQFQARTSNGEGPFLRTGDLGFLTKKEVFITGRMKDLIIIRGRNHYPQDIERSVEQSHPMIRKNGSAAISILVNGQENLALVSEIEREQIRMPLTDETWLALATKVRGIVSEKHDIQLAAWYCLRPFGLPKTTSGKARRSACRLDVETGNIELACPPFVFKTT